jgi:hypothetical protein
VLLVFVLFVAPRKKKDLGLKTSDRRFNGFDILARESEKKGGDLRANGNGEEKPWIYVRLALMSEIGDMNCLSSYFACMMFVSGEDYYTPERSSLLIS